MTLDVGRWKSAETSVSLFFSTLHTDHTFVEKSLLFLTCLHAQR